MKRFAIALTTIAIVAVALVLVLRHVSSSSSQNRGIRGPNGSAASDRFFAKYVNPDGRVVRHDEGADTVSEGQSYAMQIALAEGDAARFHTTWTWAKTHLQRSDGLFSWRWIDGHVADEESAADADVDMAVALARAADDFGRSDYRQEARRIAQAALDHETFSAGGRMVLAAGRWAVNEQIVNPSYLAPCDYDDLLAVTHDRRWQQLLDGSISLLGDILDDGLPPDWVVIDRDGSIRPIANPNDRTEAGRYGLDAARIPARLATCAEGRALAHDLWPRLATLDAGGAALAYSLDGKRLDDDTNPLGLVAAAIGAQAKDADSDATNLLTEAENLERNHSTYYGSAWLALGQDIITNLTSRGNHAGIGEGLGLPNTPTVLRDQVPTSTSTPVAPSTTIAPTTAPAPTTTVAPTTTTPPSTSTPPVTPPPTSVAPEASPTTQPPVATTTAATTPFGDPVDTSEPSNSAAGDGTDAPTSQAPQSTGRTDTAADDLIAQPSELDQPLANRHDTPAFKTSPAERARRRTGSITVGGFAGIAALGACLGLRERRMTRRRLSDL